MILIIFGAVFFLVCFGGLYISGRSATKTKEDMQCIAFMSDEAFQKIRSDFKNEKIFFTDMLWTPGQAAYNQIGTASHSPREIWIQKNNIETAKKIIELRFNVEVTQTAIIVSQKLFCSALKTEARIKTLLVSEKEDELLEFSPTNFLEASRWWFSIPHYSLKYFLLKKSAFFKQENILRVLELSRVKKKELVFVVEYKFKKNERSETLVGFFIANEIPVKLLKDTIKQSSKCALHRYMFKRGIRWLPYSIGMHIIASSFFITLIGALIERNVLSTHWLQIVLDLNQCNHNCLIIAKRQIHLIWLFSAFTLPCVFVPVISVLLFRRKIKDVQYRINLILEALLFTWMGIQTLVQFHERYICAFTRTINSFFR